MTWLSWIVMAASGTAAMRAAIDRGDLDEAARQGAIAGPAVVERALAASDRATQLAAIAAAPSTEDRAELLDALARLAAGPDRRTAIPAAGAARMIARDLARQRRMHDVDSARADDLAEDDVARWRAAWGELALRGDRWIELRLAALDTAAALDPGGVGGDLATALHDPDPTFRRAAATIVPAPAPPATIPLLAIAVVSDPELDVALGAAQSLCIAVDDAPRPVLDALGAAGVARLRAMAIAGRPDAAALREVARCLTADGSPESLAAVHQIKK